MINFEGKYSIYSANNPFIAVVDNLLSDDVIDELAKDIDEHCDFERAKVVSKDGGSEEHYSRTNKVAKNSLDYNKSQAARKFLKIASTLIRLHPAQAEPLQIVKYDLGEQYEPHSDCFSQESLAKNKNFVSSLTSNVASIYTLNLKGIRNSIILNYDSNLNDFGYWYQQLVAESLGKKKKGINPFLSFCPKDHHSLLQLYLDGPRDKIFYVFSSKNYKKLKLNCDFFGKEMQYLKGKSYQDVILSQKNAFLEVLKKKKIPFRHFVFKKNINPP